MRLRLSALRALLANLPASVVGIAVLLDDDTLTMTAFSLQPLDEKASDDLNTAVSEVVADYPEVARADFVVHVVETTRLEADGEWIILRAGYQAKRPGWAQVVFDVLVQRDLFARVSSGPVFVNVLPRVIRHSDNIQAWLTFMTEEDASHAEARRPELMAIAHAALLDAGFPAQSLPSFELKVTSVAEVNRRGGLDMAFR
jgi:hypothetical protein